jgi:inosine/xanthosine triphosphatase
MRVAVASMNPVKRDATRRGLALVLPDPEALSVVAAHVDSGVAAQPFGDDETLRGAITRAHAALEVVSDADFGVGLEGGVRASGDDLYCIAWCAIAARGDAQIGIANAGDFLLPPRVAQLVREGVELGHADDMVFGRVNSKHADGAIGVLTGGRLTRVDYYAPMVARAFVRFLNPGLYAAEKGGKSCK